MSSDGDNMSTDCVDDELYIKRFEVIEALLNDVVAVQVLNQRDDLAVESLDDQLDLVRSRNEFDHLLQSASTMLVESNSDHLWRGTANEFGALLISGIFQELLTEVIAKGI